MTTETETEPVKFPAFVNIQFGRPEAELVASLDRICGQAALNRATLAKQVLVKFLTGKLIESGSTDTDSENGSVRLPDVSAEIARMPGTARMPGLERMPGTAHESVTITKLQNQLQNAISRHNREADNLREEIVKLKREKQQIATRSNQFNAAGLGEIDTSGRGGLAGAIEAKVAERMERYERERLIRDLEKQVTDKTALINKLEKEVADLESENETLEDALDEAKEKLNSDAEIEKKLERYTAPVLNGVAKAFPALRGRIEGFVAGGLGELPGSEPLSQEDQDGLEFARDLRRKFSGEEQDMIVELMGHFHENKQLLKNNLHVTQSIAKQQAESANARDGGS